MTRKSLVLAFSLILSPLAFAQTEEADQALVTQGSSSVNAPIKTEVPNSALYEASCKIKAKEAAAAIFRSCMSDNKNAQLEQIRKDYQEKLGQMRSEYEKELNRLAKEKKSDKAMVKEPLKLKTQKNKAASYTKKGLPLKAVKTVLTETMVSTQSPSEMNISLKSSKDDGSDESMDIPEPISVEAFGVKDEPKVEMKKETKAVTELKSSETATIQLD